MPLVWTAQASVTILFSCSAARLCDSGQLSDPLWAHETVNEVLNLGTAYGLGGLSASLNRTLEEEAGSQGSPSCPQMPAFLCVMESWPRSKPAKGLAHCLLLPVHDCPTQPPLWLERGAALKASGAS